VNLHNSHKQSALGRAAAFNSIQSASVLLTQGANVNNENEIKLTPLMFAAQSPNLEMLRLLLDSGASKGMQNKSGDTAYRISLFRLRGQEDPRFWEPTASEQRVLNMLNPAC
jgi:ankyrin repeat protein